MKDFKSYNPGESGNNGGNASGNVNDFNSAAEMAKIISKAMNGKSQSQLLSVIIDEAERGKREGTLTNADLDNFYNLLAPMVDGFKRKKLKEIITRLKSI